MASLTSLHQNTQQSSIDCNGPKQTTIDLVGGILCKICRLTFATKQAFDSHYRSHGTFTDIIYTCNICYKEIVGYPSFRGHCYTSHVIKERFQCEHCLKQFSKISNLKDHVNKIHKFKCPSCRKEFSSKKEMLLHQIIHNSLDQPPFNCNTCKSEIDTADDCKEHIEKHLKFIYSCPICNENISDRENAADHMKKHFGDVLSEDKTKETPQSSEDTTEEFSGIMCQFCSLILGDRVKFDAHFSCKHGDEDIVYMCVECGKSFEKYSVFKNHCYDHSIRNRYKCQICKKAFPRLSLLAAHTAACQAAGGARGCKVFACPACSRRFASLSRWRDHLKVAHDMQRHLPCPYDRCDRTFDTPKQLILHQQSHEITNQNFCSQCRLVFTNVASCERHIDMHRKKVFFCPICKRNAKDKKVIMNHISQHFDVVSHLCRICGKIYNSKKSLIDHLKTHKKVKSYSCTHCNKSFSKPSQLEQHVNTHTGAKPYKCPICVKSFSNYPNWVKHVRRMHHEESIYIRNPIVDHPDSDDKEDPAMKATGNEKDLIKPNNLFIQESCADNQKVNNNYQLANAEKPSPNKNIDLNVTEVHHIHSIDIQNFIKEDASFYNDKAIVMEIAIDENNEVSNITTKPHTDEIFCNAIEFNHNNSINVNWTIDQTASTEENSPVEIGMNKENGINQNVQKDDFEHIPSTDEQKSFQHLSSKPHKCPICEKSFAKYSYMSKHVGRVHHIRSIDIKNLITDHKDSIDDENSALETNTNEDHELSTDNKKDYNDEHILNTDKIKIQINSNIDPLGPKPYKCTICDKSFAKYPYMTKHVRKIHNKKIIDIKNSITDHISIIDDVSSMETRFDEENSTSPDNTKDDNNIQVSNTEKQNVDGMPIGFKPHKCPICEKSFAKYPYMTKHCRKVHNKKIIDIKNSAIGHKESADEEVSAVETSIDGEHDISTDNVKDDNCIKFLNTDKLCIEHLTNISSKPYKCPTCDKSFAKHSYMSKHLRTVHNKKGVDVKNPMVDHKDSVDEDGSAMETAIDEENDIFTDHSKDDNDERISNTDHPVDIGYKPYKCPMCEKSFAQDRYCRKHVRRVHYKKNMEIKSPIFDSTNTTLGGTLMEKENTIVKSQDFLKNEISNMDSIDNIVNQAATTDCLNDIDDANASIDFANVRLENYIFGVQRDSTMDIVPSLPGDKYLLSDSSDGSAAINKDLFKETSNGNPLVQKDLIYENSKGNIPVGIELFNENGEAITLVEKDLFNANSKENVTVGKDLFNANNEENDNPIDILEYIAEMPENNSLFVPVISQEALAGCAPLEAVSYPCEYGPEFSGYDTSASGFIDLDDHMLPHIDPLLINNDTCVQLPSDYHSYDYNVYAGGGASEYNVTVAAAQYEPGWDPPIITKLCDQYAYGYGEMPEASRVPIMNTDIF